MGADYIGAFVPVTRSREEALDVLRSLPNDSIERALRNTNLDSEWDDGLDSEWDDGKTFWIFPDDGPAYINRETMIPELEKYVHIVYDIVEGKCRVASWVRHDDVLFVIAGGLSWGDIPDFVDELTIVYFLGVTYDPTKELTWVDTPPIPT